MESSSWQFSEYGQPEQVLQRKSHSLPEPAAEQALVKILCVGLNRSEFNYVQGKYAPVREFPSCLGQEAVGEIVEIGAGTNTELKVGQRVALLPGRIDLNGMGAYRDLGLYNTNALVPVPDSYSHAEGAALWMAALTMGGALDLGGINPQNAAGKRVLVTAASSSMGVVALKLLRAWGATSIATTRSADKARQLSELADHAVTCGDSQSLAAAVKSAADGFDLALDPVGELFYPGLIEAADIGASIVSYEMITGREPVMPIAQVMMKDLQLKGYTIFRPYRVPGLLDTLISYGMDYPEQIRPLIAKQYPLSEAPTAVAELGRAEHIGKIVLTV